MQVVQSYEKPLMFREPDATKIGGGVFLNPAVRYKHPYYGKKR